MELECHFVLVENREGRDFAYNQFVFLVYNAEMHPILLEKVEQARITITIFTTTK